MKPRFIQTKHSGFGEWVAEVDPRSLEEIIYVEAPKRFTTDAEKIDCLNYIVHSLMDHLTTIDMSGRVGLDAKHAAEAFRKKGFTVINLKEEE